MVIPSNPATILSDTWAEKPEQRRFLLGLGDWIARIASQFNALQSGAIAGRASASAAPTTGTWSAGDFMWNSAPAEAGSAGSKYVLIGWFCETGGTPGTWKQCRFLTGN